MMDWVIQQMTSWPVWAQLVVMIVVLIPTSGLLAGLFLWGLDWGAQLSGRVRRRMSSRDKEID